MTTCPRSHPGWLVPLVAVALGGVLLAAEASAGDLASGLAWFAVIAAGAALLAYGGRFASVRDARGDTEDERDALINTRAMAAAGIVLVVALTGGIVYQLVRGDDPSPYAELMAAGGATYAVSLLAGERGALLVTVDGRAAGVVTRADLLEALAR